MLLPFSRNLGSDGQYPDSRAEPQWAAVYRSLDVISPWAASRFRDDNGADAFARQRLTPDIAETGRLGIEYMSVIFPGFSWRHGAGWATNSPLNLVPRRCGAFYQREIDNAVKAGAQMLYTAMFDEINEGTAIFKLAVDPSQEPAGTDLFGLDADGCRTATQRHVSSPRRRSDARVANGAVSDRPAGCGLSATVRRDALRTMAFHASFRLNLKSTHGSTGWRLIGVKHLPIWIGVKHLPIWD
jgi:hypothetical protein